MATDTAQENRIAKTNEKAESKIVTYVPLGETESVELTMGQVKNFIAVKTRRGNEPSVQDLVKFMMLCKARALNPWVGDAYLVGYDSERDGPTFSLITSIQALLKRAEMSPDFDGIKGGVIVKGRDGQLHRRMGKIVLEDEVLLGGWAELRRKDCQMVFEDELPLHVYSTGRSRWRVDPAGMITKCCKASVLREAFPTQCGGLHMAEEFDRVVEGVVEKKPESIATSSLDEVLAAEETKPREVTSEKAKVAKQKEPKKPAKTPEPTTEKEEPGPAPDPAGQPQTGDGTEDPSLAAGPQSIQRPRVQDQVESDDMIDPSVEKYGDAVAESDLAPSEVVGTEADPGEIVSLPKNFTDMLASSGNSPTGVNQVREYFQNQEDSWDPPVFEAMMRSCDDRLVEIRKKTRGAR